MPKITEDELLKLTLLFKNLWMSAEKECEKLAAVMRDIACYDDEGANERLERTGSYSSFDEPTSVQIARAVLAEVNKEHDDAVLNCGGEISTASQSPAGHPSSGDETSC